MSGQNKQGAKKAGGGGGGGGGGWGSLFSGAVANLESRLDTILAEDGEASARQRASEAALRDAKTKQGAGPGNLTAPTAGSREASRSRVNDRLAERLAKATAAKTPSQAGSAVPSRVASPANDTASSRTSGEHRRSGDVARSVPEAQKVEREDAQADKAEADNEGKPVSAETGTLLSSGLPINPARVSIDSPRASSDVAREDDRAAIPTHLQNGHAAKTTTELEEEMQRMRAEHTQAEKQRQEEMHTYLEKIDALQAKLQYLAKETVAAAKEANASSSASSDGNAGKLAEKDERIALLMEEGEKLSKTELRHLQTIKKLRAKGTEEEKTVTEIKRRLERAEKAEAELKAKLRKAEVGERQANVKTQQISSIEKQVEELRVDRENASELIRTLSSQLKDAKAQVERAEKEANVKAAEGSKEKIAAVENELEDARIERKLADDRAAAEAKKAKEELARAQERYTGREMELKNEITSLESRLEAMRLRVEEATAGESGAGGVGGDGASVKLMRQVETLQTQYAQAKENWEVIEGSLTARVSALEGERDEAGRRETEVRRKAREAGAKTRVLEGELEALGEEKRGLVAELREQKEEVARLGKKVEQSEKALEEARAELERQRVLWRTETEQKVEDERLKWQRTAPSTHHTASPTARKSSLAELSGLGIGMTSRRPSSRLVSNDLSALQIDHHRSSATHTRRPSAIPTTPASIRTPTHPSPALSRQQSELSIDHQQHAAAGFPPTPSIEVDDDDRDDDAHTLDRASQSPQRTLNDLVSTSTAGAGPSVQLVERMSAAVRRLEAEKATFKDEIARLAGQRDDARGEVVRLMREAEDGGRERGLEAELARLREREEVCLGLLGEREEEVEVLREEVGVVKRMWRELVEERMPG